MKKYEDFIAGLRQDADPPNGVWEKYTDVLDNIEQLSEHKKGETIMRAGRKTSGNTWIKAAAVAGVLIAGVSMLAVSNPVAASKLPIIGRIFETVGDDVVYSGDYSAKKVLQDESHPDPILVQDQGITITASEVYSDGYSVYLAAKIESEKGGFDQISSHYTRRFEEKTSQSIYAGGTWSIDGGEVEHMNNHSFEGKAVDDHTFIGMMKLDQEQYSAADGTLSLELSDLYYDDVSELSSDKDSIEPACRFEGTWNLSVPYSVDKEQCREILVGQKNEDGYGIEKVFISPYQVIVFSDVPYTTLSPESFTREEFEEIWGKKNEKIAAAGEKPVTYEDLLSEKYYEQYEVAVFDQDGKALEMSYGYENRTVFAVQEHEISKLHIYMSGEAGFDLIKAVDEKEAKQMSTLDAEVEL